MEILLDTMKWSAAVGAAALALTALKPLLDRRYSPKWRYGVWLALAALLLLAPVQWEAFWPEAPTPAPAVTIEVPRMEVSVSREEGVRVQAPAVLPAPGGTAGAASAQVWGMDQALTALWLAGAAAFALYHLAGTLLLQRRARRWSRAPGEETLAVYSQVCREMKLRGAPALRVSARVGSPLLAGLLRPCLLLPGEDFGRRELNFILRHELTHWRRRDLWYKLALLLANAVHWFNPLVYLMSREAAQDMELTCDALVMAGAGPEDRRAYSETLLASIHRQKGFAGRSALTTHFYGGAAAMKERFRHILGRQGRSWGGAVLALTLLATVAAACTVGVSQAGGAVALDREALDAWQERLNSDPELEPYLHRMYTDTAYIPSAEVLESVLDPTKTSLGYPDLDLTVVSGTQDGDTVTLELEGWFTSQLTAGTLTLVDEKPVSLTTPLYTAVEKMAWNAVNASTIAGEGVEIAERCITNLWCSDTFQLDGRDWYVWELGYYLKPADISQVVLAGGMEERNGWISDFYNAPVFLVSSYDGSYILDYTATQYTKEYAYTWPDYVYGTLTLGLDLESFPILNGWPEIDGSFLESLQNGHETWALEWEDAARTYMQRELGLTSGGAFVVLRDAPVEDNPNYDRSLAVQTDCEGRTLVLFLTHATYNDETPFWQVNAADFAGDPPPADAAPEEEDVQTPAPEDPDAPLGYETEAGPLSAEELEAFAAYFNPNPDTADNAARNGLLRFPYGSAGEIGHYLEILFYDAGEYVSDEAERSALEERMNAPIETDCSRLTRDYIREFLTWYFVEPPAGAELARLLEEDVSLPNLPEYDAFYLVHGDTMMDVYEFDRGEREADGTVKLYYTTNLYVYTDTGEMDILWDQPMCAAMRLTGNGVWGMVSNTMVE